MGQRVNKGTHQHEPSTDLFDVIDDIIDSFDLAIRRGFPDAPDGEVAEVVNTVKDYVSRRYGD